MLFLKMFAVCADELTEQGKCLNLSYIQLKMLVLKHSVWGCLGALTLSVKFLSSSSHINLITAVLIELRNSEIGRFKGSN